MQTPEQRRSQAPPNILLVMADQLSALATSPYGNRDVLTPHLHTLSARGTVFERSYCNAPLCAPSRASMLTGLLSSRLPVNDNAEELPATAVTFVHYLRRAGYRTVLSGKMHYVGPDQLHGFEERLTTDIYPADFLWTKTWDSQGDPPRRVGLPGDAETGPSYVRQMAQMVKEAGPVPWSYQHDYDEETHHRALGELRTLARRRGTEDARPLVPLRLLHPPPRPLRQPAPVLGPLRGAGDQPPEPPRRTGARTPSTSGPTPTTG